MAPKKNSHEFPMILMPIIGHNLCMLVFQVIIQVNGWPGVSIRGQLSAVTGR
jgi:hypothetical protein